MKVGFIGLGNVGGKLAKSLLRNKFDLTVRDIDQNLTKSFIVFFNLAEGFLPATTNGNFTFLNNLIKNKAASSLSKTSKLPWKRAKSPLPNLALTSKLAWKGLIIETKEV